MKGGRGRPRPETILVWIWVSRMEAEASRCILELDPGVKEREIKVKAK